MKPMLRKVLVVFAVLACIAILGVGVRGMIQSGSAQKSYVFYEVTKTNLPIVVTERGSLESQVETTITCGVENVGDRGSSGTQIIFIVPNGSAVKKSDLLVEFDSATIRDRLQQQTVAHQKAVSAKTQANAKYKNQIIQNKITLDEANLAIKLARIEYDMYVDQQVGTAKLAKEEIERKVDEAKNSALEARAQLELAEVERAGIKELFKLGYRGKSELEQSRLKYLQAEDRLASSRNQVKTHQGSRRKLDKFESKMEELRLEGAHNTAIRNLEQVKNDNESLLQQSLAAKNEAESTEAQELERLLHMEEQLANCKIFAPHDGMVVYKQERRGGTEIQEGAVVRERQDILTLPDLSKMKVKTQVHEAVLDQVRPGLPTSVRIDAFPDRVYRGVVDKVGVVPSSSGGWFNSGSAKTYETIVRIVDEVDQLKPGMTAVVNMHVDRVEGVLAVPVQAIIQADQETWCYVAAENGVERRDIKIGRSNDKFVHIREGVSEGQKIVLNSMDIFDQQNQEPSDISAESGVPEMPESLADVGYDAPPDDPAADRTAGPGTNGRRGAGQRRQAGEGQGRGPAAGRQFGSARGEGGRAAGSPSGGRRGGRQPSGASANSETGGGGGPAASPN